MDRKIQCPECGGDLLLAHEYERKGQALGAGLGIVTACLSKAKLSAVSPLVRAAASVTLSRVVNGAVLGSALGAQVGSVIDEQYIRKYQCQSCGSVLKMS